MQKVNNNILKTIRKAKDAFSNPKDKNKRKQIINNLKNNKKIFN